MSTNAKRQKRPKEAISRRLRWVATCVRSGGGLPGFRALKQPACWPRIKQQPDLPESVSSVDPFRGVCYLGERLILGPRGEKDITQVSGTCSPRSIRGGGIHKPNLP